MPNDLKDQKEKLLELVKNAISQDQALRDQHKIGEKFRFIREKLQALLARVEGELSALKIEEESKTTTLAPDEVFVYVYLFNAQGLVFQTWKKMVNASVFYEYSVNRPIYGDIKHVEANIRTKTNRNQHGFITVAVKKENILSSPTETRDINGNPVLKVKEGSLRFERFLSFTHNEHEYIISPEGELIRKSLN